MKKILIVGGNSGIGLALGKRLLADQVELIQWSRTEGDLGALGARWSEWDCSDPTPDIEEPLDGLVYLPGTIKLKPFHRISEQDFLRDFEVNALGAAKVLQATHGMLKKGEAPSVVLFSSVAATLGLPFHASISMAKAAVEGLARSVAAEWAPMIRVNAIAPSLTDTPLANVLLNSEAKKEASAARHPLKKVGSAEDIAALAHFLLSANAAFVTGQTFTADGGIGSLRV